MVDTVQKCCERIVEALDDSNSIRALAKIQRNAGFAVAALEGDGILTEALGEYKKLQLQNKKISMATHSRAIDNVLVFVFLKSLMQAPKSTKAFKAGLIDAEGNLIKIPETPEEEDMISNLDLLVAKLRKWLAPHIQKLAAMSWLRSTENDIRIQNALSNADAVSKRYTVIRVNNELEKILKQP